MREPKIKCRWCKGTGCRPLSKPLLRVFKAIVKLRRPTCPEIYQEINIDYQDSTVANIYVRKLMKAGLVKKLPLNGERWARYQAV